MAPAGASALPLITICCGWNGALPPSAVSRLMAVRLANMPRPARSAVFGLSAYARPIRGWNTRSASRARPSGRPWIEPVELAGMQLREAVALRLGQARYPAARCRYTDRR